MALCTVFSDFCSQNMPLSLVIWSLVAVLVQACAGSDLNDGQPAHLATCNTSDPGQQWVVQHINSSSFYLQNSALFPKEATKCLDISNWDKSDQASVREWHCTITKNYNQVWMSTGTFLQSSIAMSSKCLVAAAVMAGSSVQMHECAVNSTTAWILPSTAGLVKVANSNFCLSVSNISTTGTNCPDPSLPYCNYSLPATVRARDLISRMTLAEKIPQLNTFSFTKEGYTPGIARLGVPPYTYHSEGLHGVRDSTVVQCNATLYPQVTAMAATGNMTLINEMATIMGTEFRALNNLAKAQNLHPSRGAGLSVYGPTINIIRSGLWGRAQESVSECPWINGKYAVQFVRGIEQRDNADGNGYLKVSTTCKHLAAYSLEKSQGVDRHHFNAVVSRLDLYDTYLPAFRACVELGRAQQVMCSYNAINGTPACLDGQIQNGLLRNAWGFNGSIVSDCDAVADAYNDHRFTKTPEETAADGIRGGCDLDCGSFYDEYLMDAVSQGYLNETALDLALERVFTMRFLMGEFDPDHRVPYRNLTKADIDTPAARASSLGASRESIVLLANNASVLPFDEGKKLKYAVIGPHASQTTIMMGGKSDYHPSFIVSILQGLADRKIATTYSPGTNITQAIRGGAAAAVAVAKESDFVILTLGLSPQIEHEAADRSTLRLPDCQVDLINNLTAAIDPSRIVLVLINGGPVSLDEFKYTLPTIVEAFYGGQSAGTALAEVLFGAVSPSGILPYTLMHSTYSRRVNMTDMRLRASPEDNFPGRTYRFFNGSVLWPFGHGLSYTTFALAWQQQSLASATPSDFLNPGFVKQQLALTITNTGSRESKKVVQLFVSTPDEDRSLNSPLKSLMGMVKVNLAASDSTSVSFEGDQGLQSPFPSVCAICTTFSNGTRAILPGSYRFQAGTLPQKAIVKVVQVHGDPVVIH
eukprot:m.256312 g.256312  ORF g.256312 m.256312 type:complete len:928 (+) comp17563_c0_seq3:1517-4300(+)